MDLVAIAPRIPVVGETIIGHTYFTEPGGKGANQAYAAALLGGQVQMLGRVGNDEFGRAMRANLERAGCDTGGLGVELGPSGVALIFVDDKGTEFDHCRARRKQCLERRPCARRQRANCGCRHRAAAAGESGCRGASRRKSGTPGWGARDSRPRARAQHAASGGIARRCGRSYAQRNRKRRFLAGLPPGNLEPAQAVVIGRRLLAMGTGTAVMKLGSQGCVIVEKGIASSVLIPAPKGQSCGHDGRAGDVFNAGLAVALGEGPRLARRVPALRRTTPRRALSHAPWCAGRRTATRGCKRLSEEQCRGPAGCRRLGASLRHFSRASRKTRCVVSAASLWFARAPARWPSFLSRVDPPTSCALP